MPTTPPPIQTLTRSQVREIDRRAIEEFGIPGIVLMENAGRNAAHIIWSLLETHPSTAPPPTVAILCGRGNNGGDGFVIARHMHNAGAIVEVFLACDPTRLTGDAATNFGIVERMKLLLVPFDSPQRIADARGRLSNAAVLIDAVLGTGFSGEVRPPLDAVIHEINHARQPTTANEPLVVAVDVPSGLDCDTGQPCNATVRADVTITFVACKTGFLLPEAQPFVGRLHVADIGAPRETIDQVSHL